MEWISDIPAGILRVAGCHSGHGRRHCGQIHWKIHNEYASAIQYNNENSLSSILSIGYLSTMRYYFKPIREFPAGRGFADFVYLPKPEYSRDYPALVVELKWNQNAQTAIRQIKNRQYPEAVTNYTDNILLVGISYDKKQKTHNCVIEKYSEK